MFKISYNNYRLLVTLFIVFSLIGYSVATTAILPFISDVEGATRLVTVPYRAITLFLTILVIVTSPSGLKRDKVLSGPMKVFIVFWILYAIRIAFDIYIRGIHEREDVHTQTSIFTFAITIPTFIATLRCAQFIDMSHLNRYMMFGILIYLGVTFLNNESLMSIEAVEAGRISGNRALNTISFGHSCLTCFIFLLCYYRTSTYSKIIKYSLLGIMIISILFMLKAGSRGPLVTLVVIFGLFLIGKQKRKTTAIAVFLIIIAVIALFYMQILTFISHFAPTLTERMLRTITENDTSGRDLLYANAIELFLRNPIIGSQYITEYGIYSHNMILDAFMGLGIIGGFTIIYLCVKAFQGAAKMIQSNTSFFWIGLMCVQEIMKNMFTGCFYTNSSLSLLLVIVLYSLNSKNSAYRY